MTLSPQAAHSLGLTAVGHQLYGSRHGVEVWVEGSGRNYRVSTMLHPPLDLGLLAYPRNGTAPRGTMAGVPMRVQHPAMNMEFRIFGDEPMRAGSVFSPALCNGLINCLHGNVDINLSDDGVLAFVNAPMFSSDSRVYQMLASAVEMVSGAAATINAQRPHIPVAQPLYPHLQAWQHYAATHQLNGMQTPLCMWGMVDGANVTAYAVRLAHGYYGMEVRVSFARPLHIGLVLEWKQSRGKMLDLFGKRSMKTGDSIFDSRFIVHAADETVAKQLFDRPTRQRLGAAGEHYGSVTADDGGIAVQTNQFPANPHATLGAIRHAAELAYVLEERYRGLFSAGPYR